MKVTRATKIPKHVLVKCCWAKSARGVPALCEEATHLSPPLFFHCLIFFAFVFQGFLSMSKWYVKYFCHLYTSIAMHCIVWSSFHLNIKSNSIFGLISTTVTFHLCISLPLKLFGDLIHPICQTFSNKIFGAIVFRLEWRGWHLHINIHPFLGTFSKHGNSVSVLWNIHHTFTKKAINYLECWLRSVYFDLMFYFVSSDSIFQPYLKWMSEKLLQSAWP